jgi:hypothetical protein
VEGWDGGRDTICTAASNKENSQRWELRARKVLVDMYVSRERSRAEGGGQRW